MGPGILVQRQNSLPGKVGGKPSTHCRVAPKINGASVKLQVKGLFARNWNEESMKVIKNGEYVPVWDALSVDEIIAVVELNDVAKAAWFTIRIRSYGASCDVSD